MRMKSCKYFCFVKDWPGDNLTKLSIPSVDTAILSKCFYFIYDVGSNGVSPALWKVHALIKMDHAITSLNTVFELEIRKWLFCTGFSSFGIMWEPGA